MTIKLPIYQLAIVDILPHHCSTMHRRRHIHDKKNLRFHNQNLLKFFHNIPIIPPRIPTHFPDFSVIQFMNTHMINQILPLLLTESTRQGIAKHNAMETVLTRHLLHIPRFLLIQDMTIPPNQDPVHFLGHHRISSLQGLFPSRKQHIEDQDSSCIHFKSLLYSHSYNSIFGFVSQKYTFSL